jgi:hypothetical protein
MKNSPFSSFRLRERIGLAAVGLGAAVFMVLRFGEFPVGAGMDDAYYIEMARSLAEGRGPVIHLNEIVPPWSPGLFPLGFPLLLSPLAWSTSASVQVFRLVPMLAVFALVPVCLLLARNAAPGVRLALAALVCLNPWAVGYGVRVFSDLPFAVTSLVVVLLFLDQADKPFLGKARFIALVVVSAGSIMIRSVGLALLMAMVVYWLGHRKWSRALLLVGGVAAVLLPHAVVSSETGGGLITPGYLQQVFAGDGTLASRIALMTGNLIGYLKELPVVLLPVFGNPLEHLASRTGLGAIFGPLQLATGFLLVGGIVWGLICWDRTNRTRSRFLAIYLLIYGGVLLNFSGYPSGVQARLLLPVMPLFFLALLEALDRVARARRGRVFWPAVALLVSLSLVHNGYRAARPLHSTPDATGRILTDCGLGADWIREHTGPTDLVMVRWPLRQHIHFQRQVVGFGAVTGQDLDKRIERSGVDYIFLGPGEPDANTSNLMSGLFDDPVRFKSVHQDTANGVVIFRVEVVP